MWVGRSVLGDAPWRSREGPSGRWWHCWKCLLPAHSGGAGGGLVLWRSCSAPCYAHSSVQEPGRCLSPMEAAAGISGRPSCAQCGADHGLSSCYSSSLQADGQGNAAGAVEAQGQQHNSTVPGCTVGFSCLQPLQAMESYLLVRALCSALGDNLGTAGALCQVTKLLLQLECPSYAKASTTGRRGRQGGQLGWSCRPSPRTDPLASSSSWKRQSPACREQTGAATPTCCCSRPASCSAASCTAPATA